MSADTPGFSLCGHCALVTLPAALAATAGADGCSVDAEEALAMAIQLIQQQQDVRMN